MTAFLSRAEKKMESWKQETGNGKLVNWSVLHFRISVSCFFIFFLFGCGAAGLGYPHLDLTQ